MDMALCVMLRIMSICKLLNMGLRMLGVWGGSVGGCVIHSRSLEWIKYG